MRKPESILFKGHEIVYIDYSNLNDKEDIFQVIDEGSTYIRSKPNGSVLSLVNMENMFFNNEIRSYLADNVKLNNPHIRRSAVFGLKGLISIMYKSFLLLTGRDAKSFNTKEEAMEYLIS